MLPAGAHGLSDGACGLRGAPLLIVTCVPAHLATSSARSQRLMPAAGENRIKKWHIDLDDAEGVPVTKVKSFRAHNDWVCGANAPRNKLFVPFAERIATLRSNGTARRVGEQRSCATLRLARWLGPRVG